MSYIANLLIQFSLYLTAALSLNIVLGYCGLFSLCQAALYGVGAYTAAILLTRAGLAFWPPLDALRLPAPLRVCSSRCLQRG